MAFMPLLARALPSTRRSCMAILPAPSAPQLTASHSSRGPGVNVLSATSSRQASKGQSGSSTPSLPRPTGQWPERQTSSHQSPRRQRVPLAAGHPRGRVLAGCRHEPMPTPPMAAGWPPPAVEKSHRRKATQEERPGKQKPSPRQQARPFDPGNGGIGGNGQEIFPPERAIDSSHDVPGKDPRQERT